MVNAKILSDSAEIHQKNDAIIYADTGFKGTDSLHVYFGMALEMSKRFTLQEMLEIIAEARTRASKHD